jgi:hypothetical protein
MADTFSHRTAAPPSAQVLQRTLQHLEILLAEPAHSRNGTWCQHANALCCGVTANVCNCWPVLPPMAAPICCLPP